MYTILLNEEKLIPEDKTETQIAELKAKRKKEYKSLRNAIIIIILFFINFFLLSNIVIINFKNDLLKKDVYWQKLEQNLSQGDLRTNCKKSTNYSQTSLDQIDKFINFLNLKNDFNYFMCFSSLYYAAKVERYDIFKATIGFESFRSKNKFYKNKNTNKCVKQEYYMDEISLDFKNVTKVHLCYLNSYLREESICDVVKIFELENNLNVNCDYNYYTGQYTIRLNEDFQLVFHEYEIDFNSFAYFYDMLIGNENNMTDSDSNKTYFGETAKLNMGILGWLFGNQYFNVPRSFFYNKFDNSRIESNFLNYLNTPFRLPSEVVNYFMVFYSSIWYL